MSSAAKPDAVQTRPAKTNAARLLDQLGIPYELRSYDLLATSALTTDLTKITVSR